jgi:rhodanese-related sulfurtransferase
MFGMEPDPREIDTETAAGIWQDNGALFVDVREPEEFAEGRVPGSTLIPLGELAQRSKELPKDARIVTVCRSGNRSLYAVDILNQQGWNDVKSMAGGMIAWKRSNREVEK